MNMPQRKFRITQTLLSSWIWAHKLDNGYEDFLRVLRREKTPQTKAMLDGVNFEGMVNAHLDGAPLDPKHKWAKVIGEVSEELQGSQKQVTLFRDTTVDGVSFLLHGVLDFLRAGVIYDTKFSTKYSVNKYLNSPQHPMYFALVPEAYEFKYIISDGKYVYRERYTPKDTEPIEKTISQFMKFLDRHKLVDLYCENWKTKG